MTPARIRVNVRRLISDAIESGLATGHRRAHKHTDTPSTDHLFEQQAAAIWLALDEHLDFVGEEEAR